jgi:hypothetical protein
MKHVRVGTLSTLMVLLCVFTQAQQSVATANDVAVPPLVNFSGVLSDLNGKPLTGVVGVTFYLYKEQQGGAPLWLETQNVTPNSSGHYTVMLGSTTSQGIPANIFASGEAHWLGVQVQGQAEQPRVLLVSAPYALKAGDAETLGGLPASAFMLAVPQNGMASANTVASATGQSTPSTSGAITGTGTVNFLPLWDSTSNLMSSVLFQSGTGSTAKVGINTTTPATTLDVKGGITVRGTLSLPAIGTATTTAGFPSYPLSLVGSTYSPVRGASVNQTFQWKVSPLLNNTATASSTLSLLYAAGSNTPEPILNINSLGQITGGAYGVYSEATAAGATGVFGTAPQFGLYGTATGTGKTVGVFGSGADGVQGSGTVHGVYGASSTAGGVGVYGTAPQFGVYGVATGSGDTVGVYGRGADGLQGSGTAHGVYAAATGASSTGVYGTAPQFGLYGVATGSSGNTVGVFGSGVDGIQGGGTVHGVYGTGANFGLYGVATATSGNSVGVFGVGVDGLQGSGSAYGVYAAATGTGSTGVYGTAPQFGLYGTATGSGKTVGVFGSGADGVQGSGTVNGVYGATSTVGATGVYGTSPTIGVSGNSTGTIGAGVWGAGANGLQGNGSQYGVYSETPAGIAGTYGVYQQGSIIGKSSYFRFCAEVCGSENPVYEDVFPQAGVWADTNTSGIQEGSVFGFVPACSLRPTITLQPPFSIIRIGFRRSLHST